MDNTKESTSKVKFHTEEKLLSKIARNIFLYPHSEKLNWEILCGFYFLLGLQSITISQLVLTFVLTGFNSLSDFSNVSSNLGLCIMTLAKYIIIHKNKKFLNTFFKHYDEVFGRSKRDDNPDIKKIMDTYMFSAKIINRVLLCYSVPLIGIVDSLPYIIMMFENEILGKELQYLYPFDGWYPFDKIEWYYTVYSWESLMTAIVIIIYMYSDMMNLFIILCFCMELRVLGCSIKNLISDSDIDVIQNSADKTRVNDKIKYKLRDIIMRHNALACICKDLDRMIGITMFGVYSMGSALMCLTAFTSTVADNSYQTIRCSCFFFSLVLDAIYHCCLGQFMSDHSIQLAQDIYESHWIYANQKTKKTLLIMLMRVQQPLKLTASGFVSMNLNTFTCIIVTAYRLFNLLHTVYEP